jgi:hypothetical protein
VEGKSGKKSLHEGIEKKKDPEGRTGSSITEHRNTMKDMIK